MIALHPTQCSCADCRNRRLISSWDVPGEGYLAAALKESGSLSKNREPGRREELPPLRSGPRQAPSVTR